MTRIAITALLTTAALLALAGCEKKAQYPAGTSRKMILEDAINTTYENPQAHYELGRIYQNEGNLIRAEFHYNVAMGFDPTSKQSQVAMVRLKQQSANPQQAQELATMYIQQASVSAVSSMDLGRAFHREGLYDYALQCYQQAEGLNPEDPMIHKQLGYFFLRQGDKVRAEGALRRSFELNPDQPDVSSELGRMGVMVQVPPRKAVNLTGPYDTNKVAPDPTIK